MSSGKPPLKEMFSVLDSNQRPDGFRAVRSTAELTENIISGGNRIRTYGMSD